MSEEIEEWRPVVGYEGLYQVSDHGRVCANWAKRGPIPMKPSLFNGYKRVNLKKQAEKRKQFFVHRLVAFAFLGPQPSQQHVVNHIDGKKTNNHLYNLEWCTYSDNSLHAIHVLGVGRRRKQWRVSSPEKILELHEAAASGRSVNEIAADFNMDRSSVWRILNRPARGAAQTEGLVVSLLREILAAVQKP